MDNGLSLIRKQGSGEGDVTALPCIYRFPVTEQIDGSESSSLEGPRCSEDRGMGGEGPSGNKVFKDGRGQGRDTGPLPRQEPRKEGRGGEETGHHPALDRVSTEGAHRAATCLYSSATQKQQHGNHVCDLKACATNEKSRV